jgi:hypothetical protein
MENPKKMIKMHGFGETLITCLSYPSAVAQSLSFTYNMFA